MKLTERINKARFHWAIRSIASTPPVTRSSGSLTALSMVQHRDVLPYLLALKSFTRFVPAAQVVLVADPTLNGEDRALIRDHVPHIVFREAAEFHRSGIPRGGCWERLSAIAEYAGRGGVVQLDADTVAIAPLADVARAVADGVSFTLGTEDGQQIGNTHDLAAWAQGRLDGNDHIQGLAEACLDRLDPTQRYRYVRGCAGFAGFAAGSIDADAVLDVSRRMGALMGDKWATWGTEQFTSNLLVASAPGARVLPHPIYCAPHRRTPDTVFFHFIGYVRYAGSLYARVAADVARELTQAPGQVLRRHAA